MIRKTIAQSMLIQRIMPVLKRNVHLKILVTVENRIAYFFILRKLVRPIVNMDLVQVRVFVNTAIPLASATTSKTEASVMKERNAE